MGTLHLYGSFGSFEAMHLLPEVVRGLTRVGCSKPTAVQQEAIVPLLYHRDIIVEADIGSGSTTAYGAAILHLCDPRSDFVQAVIVTSSHRYADQIFNVLRRLARFVPLRLHLCGSVPSVEQERRELAANFVHIMIGSASQVHKMARDGVIRISKATILVVDKTNEVFARNLDDSLVAISRYISSKAQYAFFSETMPKNLDGFVAKLGLKCSWISARAKLLVCAPKLGQQVSMSGIKHFFLLDDSYKVFYQLEELLAMSPAIIYGGSRGRVEGLANALRSRVRELGSLHEASTPNERGIVIQQFRAGIIKIVIVSDDIVRQSELVQAPLIINIGLPTLAETYAQRTCRPERNGKSSVVINIVKTSELALLGKIEEQYGVVIEELPMTEEEIEPDEKEMKVQISDIAPRVEADPAQIFNLDSDEEPDGLFTM